MSDRESPELLGDGVLLGPWREGIERSLLDHGDGILHDAHLHARLATDP